MLERHVGWDNSNIHIYILYYIILYHIILYHIIIINYYYDYNIYIQNICIYIQIMCR